MRKISYAQAINEAFHQVMANDDRVFQIGVGINTPWYVGNTMKGLLDSFGETRMIDTPVSENGITGISVGSALTGMRPILTFPRMDFMYYAMDQICNHAAILNYTFGGNVSIPLTIRAIINRGGEQAAQHSQALQALFMHVPGLKIVMPSNAFDAKGLLIEAVEDDNPVLYIEDRWLYDEEMEVPEEDYRVPIGQAKLVREGTDITIVSYSYMMVECQKAIVELTKQGINPELIDLRSIKPMDITTIIHSLKKTGRLLIVDGGWKTGGVAAEIAALVADEGFALLKTPVKRLTLPDLPAPSSKTLEKIYYPTHVEIIKGCQDIIHDKQNVH
ncbi:MAG: alpha-ketoacid dehydrogenase subunit beta [Candidatus Omnitrophica bacterium]|nr:alpha-ketoacid dehydrogenase subunit beta [Candidatus Omnitrophota bacterium]